MAAMMTLQVNLALFCLLAASIARAQPGSLHIACGAPEQISDPLGVTWDTDAAYIATGEGGMTKDWKTHWEFWLELRYVRYFPSARGKNCFTLPVMPKETYMLRATFMYGYYDGAAEGAKYPSFQLALDSSIVENVTIPSPYFHTIRELTFRATRNETSFCLLRDASGTVPFINALALRRVPTLPAVILEYIGLNQSVSTMTRTQFHISGGATLMYDAKGGPLSDKYDRYWGRTNGSSIGFYPMSAAGFVTSTAPLEFPVTSSSVSVDYVQDEILTTGIPPNVLQGAVTTTGTLTIPLNTTVPFKALIYYYFVELDEFVNATDRIFSVESAGALPISISVANFTKGPLRLFDVAHLKAEITYDSEIVMYRSPASTSLRGPILSALEVFKVAIPAAPPTNDRDSAAISSISYSDTLLKSWGGDPCLPVPHEWLTCMFVPSSQAVVTAVSLSGYNLTGAISPAFNQLLAITSLDLSNNSLTGSIPDLRALKNLKTLRLHNNKLTGPLPAWLASLPLEELLVQNNDLSGDFAGEFLTKKWKFDYSGNPQLISGAPSPTPKTNIGLIIGAAVGAIVAAGIIITLIVFCVCRRRRRGNSPIDPSASSTPMPGAGAREYTLSEMDAATEKYKKQIGKGGFGPVYYGRMPDGKEVAVKVLDTASSQGKLEFFNEVDILSRVHHRHLVSLYGYCRAKGKMMLVYEYIHKGTLRDHLNGRDASIVVLDWKTRLNIGLQAALGLEYLHTYCNPSLIHRDVKSTNILITSNNEAKVADFGLSRLVSEDDSSQVLTMVKGTAGYLDPEYYQSNYLSIYSDVYSFGVVLLELITGRMPISRSTDPNQVNRTLIDWFRTSVLADEDIEAIMDPKLRASRPSYDALWKVAEIALRSVEPKSVHRPTMNVVVQELLGAAALEADSDASSNRGHRPPPPAPPRSHSRIPSGHSDYASNSQHQLDANYLSFSASYPDPR